MGAHFEAAVEAATAIVTEPTKELDISDLGLPFYKFKIVK
jgi:hypothetical protein